MSVVVGRIWCGKKFTFESSTICIVLKFVCDLWLQYFFQENLKKIWIHENNWQMNLFSKQILVKHYLCFLNNDFKKGDPAEIFWKYFQNKWFSWSYKTTNLTEKWRNCWVFWRKSRYFDWFKYGFSITPTEFITYFQNISAGSPFSSQLFMLSECLIILNWKAHILGFNLKKCLFLQKMCAFYTIEKQTKSATSLWKSHQCAPRRTLLDTLNWNYEMWMKSIQEYSWIFVNFRLRNIHSICFIKNVVN